MTIKEKIKAEEQYYEYLLRRSTEEKFKSGRGKIVAERMLKNQKKKIDELRTMEEG